MIVRVDEVGGKSLSRANKLLAGIPGGTIKANYSALKRAGETAKTRAGQFAAAEYTINKGDFMRNVNQKSRIEVEAGGVVTMTLSYAGNVLPLLSFNTRLSKNGLLHTQIKRTNSAAILEHAFAARVYGPIGVFERLSGSRFPVEQKFGPSTAHMMQSEEVVKNMDETIREVYERRMDQEINRILNGWGGG